MAEPKHDYVADIKKYVPSPDEAAVAGIVRHLGIALHKRDSSLVSASDPKELERVCEGFMKKKLALTQSDAELDSALHDVMTRMHGVHDKSRVTVCYLLAEKFGKLDQFHPKTAASS